MAGLPAPWEATPVSGLARPGRGPARRRAQGRAFSRPQVPPAGVPSALPAFSVPDEFAAKRACATEATEAEAPAGTTDDSSVAELGEEAPAGTTDTHNGSAWQAAAVPGSVLSADAAVFVPGSAPGHSSRGGSQSLGPSSACTERHDANSAATSLAMAAGASDFGFMHGPTAILPGSGAVTEPSASPVWEAQVQNDDTQNVPHRFVSQRDSVMSDILQLPYVGLRGSSDQWWQQEPQQQHHQPQKQQDFLQGLQDELRTNLW
uniref:Uncharacterized protein n=1 Tax=Pyrodinium bahamense TaxID=73915 RepID=A0A7S0B9R3_9DINO